MNKRTKNSRKIKQTNVTLIKKKKMKALTNEQMKE